MVLYFSGTGNSRYAAELIALVVGDKAVSMNELIKSKREAALSSDTPYVFVSPIYGGRIPRAAAACIMKTKLTGNNNAYFLVTCAEKADRAAAYAKKICKRKKLNFLGQGSVIMPQNHLVMLNTKTDEENERILTAAASVIKKYAGIIKTGKALPADRSGSLFMSAVLNPLMYITMMGTKGFYTTDACAGCGGCAERCALNNIKMANGKPVWGKKCTHCMACIGGCPRKAVEYGKNTPGRNRYYNTKNPQL